MFKMLRTFCTIMFEMQIGSQSCELCVLRENSIPQAKFAFIYYDLKTTKHQFPILFGFSFPSV